MRIASATAALMLAAASMLASGCGDRSAAAGPAAEDMDMAGVASAPAEPAERAAGGACTAGFLPVTGLCADARPALFSAIDAQRELFDPACVWAVREAPVSADEAILFRTQDCSARGWDVDAYRWEDGSIWARPASLPDEPGVRILTVFDLADGATAEQAALATLDTAPPEQRDRCVIHDLPWPNLAGRAFDIRPDDQLMAELDAAYQGEVFDACGDYGLTDAAQVWEARATRALFHALGQDSPMWDPASYTFYRRGGDGVWRKDG